MTPTDRNDRNSEDRREVVITTADEGTDAVDVPDTDPRNETPTQRAAKLQQSRETHIIPDNEDG